MLTISCKREEMTRNSCGSKQRVLPYLSLPGSRCTSFTFLESEGMPNPSKILGHAWNKDNVTPEPFAKPFPQEHPVTKRTILSYLGTVYDPLGIISATMAEGKHIYREACDDKKGWNAEVSPRLKNQLLR